MAQPKTAPEKTWRDVFYTTSVALAKGEKAPADKYSGPILDLGFGFKKQLLRVLPLKKELWMMCARFARDPSTPAGYRV